MIRKMRTALILNRFWVISLLANRIRDLELIFRNYPTTSIDQLVILLANNV